MKNKTQTKQSTNVEDQLTENEEHKKQAKSESAKRLAVVINNWDIIPWWLKAKIIVVGMFFYYRHLFMCFLRLRE